MAKPTFKKGCAKIQPFKKQPLKKVAPKYNL